jgi:hypothetical protein
LEFLGGVLCPLLHFFLNDLYFLGLGVTPLDPTPIQPLLDPLHAFSHPALNSRQLAPNPTFKPPRILLNLLPNLLNLPTNPLLNNLNLLPGPAQCLETSLPRLAIKRLDLCEQGLNGLSYGGCVGLEDVVELGFEAG